MKTLKLIKFFIGLAAVLVIVGVVLVIVVFVTLEEGEYVTIGEPHLEIISESLNKQLTTLLPASDDQVLLAVKSLDTKVPIHLGFRIIIISLAIFVSVYFGLLLEIIKKIIEDVEQSKPFNLKNIRRLKRFGILVTMSPIFEWILNIGFSFWLKSKLPFDELKLVLTTNMGWPVFILGLLIIVLGAAFEQGYKIQEENELTI